MFYATNFLTYFQSRTDVSAEQPPTSNLGGGDCPLARGRYYYTEQARLVAPTAPSLNDADARSNATISNRQLFPSAFTAMLKSEPKLSSYSIYSAAGLRLNMEEPVFVDGKEVVPLVLKEWALKDGLKILHLYLWLGDITREYNSLDYLAGSPETPQSLVDRAIGRVCKDAKFWEEYNSSKHTKAARLLYHTNETWTFDPATAKDSGLIATLRTELILLAKSFSIALILELREKTKLLVARSTFGGLSMPKTYELPQKISEEAWSILNKIGRDEELNEHEITHRPLDYLCRLSGQGVQHLYNSDAIRELTNVLLTGLGLLNVACGVTFATRGVTFPASVQGQLHITGDPLPVMREAALPAACLAISAAFIEFELRKLSELWPHFGHQIDPVSTLECFSRGERLILTFHRRALVHLNTLRQPTSLNQTSTPELRELARTVEITRRHLDNSVNISAINKMLVVQTETQQRPIWRG